MNTLKSIAIALFLVVGLVASAAAQQKIGHLNSAALLSELPEMKAANSKLEAFGKQKEKEIEAKSLAANKFYQEALIAQQKGTLSPQQAAAKEQELNQKRADIAKAQQTAGQAVTKKQQELLQPIFDKVNKAIEDVAKTNGFDMILDTKNGDVLFSDSSQDVTKLVKAKLGM